VRPSVQTPVPSRKKTKITKGNITKAGGMVQVVDHLLGKCKTLSSSHSSHKFYLKWNGTIPQTA
jgi:hypothetical protein